MKLKKILATVLAFAMVLSTMSFTVFAEVTTYNVANDEELAEALSNAVDGDTIKLAAGDYTGGISVGKEITVEGSVDEDGKPTTVFSGDKGGNYYSYSIYMNKGTIKNIKIVDAWKGIMTEGKGSLTIDNVTIVEAGYGIHIAEAKNTEDTVTVQNSNIDVTWACSFAGGPYSIVIKNNVFTSNDPYYTNGSGTPVVNSFVENTTVEDNYFGEDAKIAVRADFTVGTNYYEDGVENALHGNSNDDAKVPTYYADREMTEVAITPDGTITIGYTSQTRIWGEGGSNSKESFIVELYAGDDKIAQASLNNYEGIIDGDLYVTWGIPFNGQDSNYWDVEWYGNNPNVNVIPTKVVLVVDGMKVDENVVQLNAPDNLNGVIWNELEGIPAEAKIGNVKYDTLEEAIAAAQNGDVIDLMGNVVELDGNYNGIEGSKDLTFQNGTMNFTDARADDSVFFLWGEDITFENIKFVKEESDVFMCYLMNVSSADTVVNFTNCEFNFTDEIFSSYIANNAGGTITFTNCKINECVGSNFVYGGGALFDTCVYNSEEADIIAHNNFPSEIRNSQVVTKRIRIRNVSLNQGVTPTVSITGNSNVLAVNGIFYTSTPAVGEENALVFVEEGSTLIAENSSTGILPSETDGTIISKADMVYVQFKQIDFDANGKDIEGYDKYEIVLVGANAEKINELASADLTFDFNGTPVTGGAMDYTVEPANGVSLSQIGDRFMFNYNGVDKYEESGAAIVIGTITIDGYGEYTLKTDSEAKNAVYATEIRDNIVDGFEDAATLVINTDLKADDGMVGKITGGVIAVPTRELTITIDFPNEVKDNAAAYQDMKVEITGVFDGETKTVPYVLGDNMVNGSYVLEDIALVRDNAYTVTVSGAGYRTARYTVTMTTDKTLRFWNNVMDEAQVVEVGKDSSIAKVTFLAGDIVKDNNINIYDLSAVVSYFGSVSTTENGYAKYDLNRDGVIDSKDVAYVLVSWNN